MSDQDDGRERGSRAKFPEVDRMMRFALEQIDNQNATYRQLVADMTRRTAHLIESARHVVASEERRMKEAVDRLTTEPPPPRGTVTVLDGDDDVPAGARSLEDAAEIEPTAVEGRVNPQGESDE